ncbi:MAG: cation-translocating P-type ATPase [Bacteroidetes bacterium]|nr:cation-translocating P-type ATPase [Bacteroidota bacterium]
MIPADGTIIEGLSLINASVLTGESEALRKSPGDEIQAGTTNETGVLIIRVDASGHRTRVGQLLSWVGERSHSQPTLSGLADRIGGLFTISVLGLALVGFAFWSVFLPEEAVMHVVAFLVITCPCALGMATPLALAVGTGRAARRGIFIKSEQVVDWVDRVDTVVLDKTGTLTEGQMAVDTFTGDETLLSAACALERDSNHPIARALLSHAEAHDLLIPGPSFDLVTDNEHITGSGIRGQIGETKYRVGNPEWTCQLTAQTSFSVDHARFIEEATTEGKTVIAITSSHNRIALVSLSDPIRPSSFALVEELQERGIRLLLCSGDDENTCEYIGGRLGLAPEDCLGRHTPEQKRAVVDSLILEGHVVAMIGDGVNDAAALKAAQVGIAVSGASTASRMAADAFTTRPGLEAVSELLKESESVLRLVRRNLGFSLVYNVLGGIVALAGFVTPLFAAVAMPISSFIVVVSSIRQKSFGAVRDRS